MSGVKTYAKVAPIINIDIFLTISIFVLQNTDLMNLRPKCRMFVITADLLELHHKAQVQYM